MNASNHIFSQLLYVADALKADTSLQELTLYSTPIDTDGASALGVALSMNRVLTKLTLADNGLGFAGATALAQTLPKWSIHALILGYGMASSAAIAPECICNLIFIIAFINFSSWNKIGSTGATAIAGAVKSHPTLTALSLPVNEIGDVGAAAVAEVLTTNTVVTFVDIHENGIGDVGATALASALRVNTGLHALKMSDNNIGTIGATALAQAFTVNESLRVLLSNVNVMSSMLYFDFF